MTQTPEVTLVRRWFGEGMTAGSAAAARGMAAEIFADDFIDHAGLGEVIRGRERWLDEVIDAIFAAFSNVEVRIEHAFGAEDLVSVRYVFCGDHTGPFAGVPGTGRRIRHSENEIYRIAGGRVAESWGEGDWTSLLGALDALADCLLPHLRAEEDEAMPLVSTVLSDAEWRAWDHQHNVKGKSLRQLATDGHWLMDGLDRTRYRVLIHLVPPPARLLIVKGFARRYRTACARLWGPEITVKPLD